MIVLLNVVVCVLAESLRNPCGIYLCLIFLTVSISIGRVQQISTKLNWCISWYFDSGKPVKQVIHKCQIHVVWDHEQ